MSIRIKFYFERQSEIPLLIKYKLPDEDWIIVHPDYQNLSHHEVLTSRQTVSNYLQNMTRYRALYVSLPEEDATPYVDCEFGSLSVHDTSDLPTESNVNVSQSSPSSDSAVLSAIQELLKSQQEMFAATMKCFQGATQSDSTRKQKLEITKFDGRNEDAKVWMKSYERVCEHNGWTTGVTKINGMKAQLIGNASKWYQSMERDETEDDWELWKNSFISSFGQNRISAAISADKWEYRGGELLDYYFEKQRLIQIGYPSLDEFNFVTKVIAGLPEAMQAQILTHQLDTRRQLRMALEQLKPIKMVRPNVSRPLDQKVQPKSMKPKPNENCLIKQESEKYPHKIPPHFSENLIDSRNEIFYDGNVFKCRFDTGADTNLVNLKFVRSNKIDTKPTKLVTVGYTGKSMIHSEKCNLTITYGLKTASLEFMCVENLPYPFLIGESGCNELGIGLKPIKEINLSAFDQIVSWDDAIDKFPSLFEENLKEPSFSVNFDLKPDAKIVAVRSYRLSGFRYEWLQNKIKDLLKKKIIQKSYSKFASPITLVEKENRNFRMCTDFRLLNKETQLDPFPFPIIDDIVNLFSGCNFFTKIDLKDGFWQIGLTEDTRQFSAFVTPFGHFEWTRLPFGWKNSPSLFQRRMNDLLEDFLSNRLGSTRVCVYLDDICIGGRNKDECSRITFQVLQRLESAGMTVNKEKSHINVSSVHFLGRIIDGNTKTTKEESVEKVKSMVRPYDLSTLRQFTGLTGHFRAYIKDYAGIVRPLDRLKQKDVAFEWDEKCESAFNKLKDLISSNPILQLPDPQLPFELCSDASHYGSGSILYQRDISQPKNKQLRVVGYQSYTFTKPEINYSITEKEALGVIKAIKYFRSYIEGTKFIVHTDHIALKYLLDQKEPKGRLARWQNLLQGYEMIINHRPGRLLTDADALSRLCVEAPVENLLVSRLSENPHKNTPIFITNPDTRLDILRYYHDDLESGGHDGFWRCYYKIKARFTWPGMKQQIKDYVRTCHTCQTLKPQRSFDIPYSPMLSTEPFSVLHIDFGELAKKSETQRSTKSFLLVIDEATRFLAGKAMRETSRSVIDFLNSFKYIKKVETIISDNGTAFTSATFVKWASENNIKLKNSSPYHPASNGMIERKMRDIKQHLRLYEETKGYNWKERLDKAIQHYNRSYNSAIGCTPLYKVTSNITTLAADKIFKIQPENIQEINIKPRKRIKNKNSTTFPKIIKNDLVMVKFGKIGKKKILKGPFKVIEIKYYDGIPKTVIYNDDDGNKAVAHFSNVYQYHKRCCD